MSAKAAPQTGAEIKNVTWVKYVTILLELFFIRPMF